jgi:phospholipase/carboxylesterase
VPSARPFLRPASVSLTLVLALVAGCTPVDAQRAPHEDRARAEPAWGGLTVVERGDPRADAALVLLHGWGAPGDDLVPLGEELASAAPMRVIVPAAPRAMSHGGRAWYDLHATDAEAQAARARRQLEGVVATLEARGVPARRIVVGGFSQGAILSIEVGLARRTPIAGLAVLSGRALEHPARAYAALRGVPIFQSHGRADDRIPFARGEAFRVRATDAGALVEHLPFEGGHAIPPEVVRALGAWLGRVLAR